MGDDLKMLADSMEKSGFKTDAKVIRTSVKEIESYLEVLHNMKDDGLDISDETIARIRNAWSGN